MYSYYSEPIYDDAVNRRLPPPRNQQYEDELDREYLGGGNRYGQLPRRRDSGRTMRGVYAPYSDETPWCIRMDEDPINEFRDEVRGMFKELTQKMGQQAGIINELKKQVSQIASAVYERREEELNEDSPSVEHADVSTINARTSDELQQNTETSAEDILETSAGYSDSGKEIPNSNTPILFSMQVIAPKDHTIDKDELEGRLEVRHEKNDPTMESPLTTNHGAPPGKSKDSGTLTITRDVDSYILQMGDASDNGPLALILGRSILFDTRTKNDMGTKMLSLAFAGKTSNFHVHEDSDPPYMRKRPSHGTFGWKPGWRGTRAPLDEGYEHHKGVQKFDLEQPWDPNL